MKNDLINSIISSNKLNNNENIKFCSICKCDNISIRLSNENQNELKILKTKLKLEESEYSKIIKKCNCTKKSPKAHKLCVLLNILYNFNLKCSECNADYNIVVTNHINTSKKILNICSLIIYLFINLIIYGASVFLILNPLIIDKNKDNNPEKNKFEHVFYFFGGLIFLLNTFFIYVTISCILFNNHEDINDYSIDIKDINETNKSKNTDKYYNMLYKFFRYFYKAQIRYLIEKKHKSIYIARGYGYFNKGLKDLIIKNNVECEKEYKLYNGGEDILNINKNNNKNDKNCKENEISNGNIEKNDIGNVKRSSTLKEEGNKNKENKSKENENNTDYLPQVKNENIFSSKQNNNNIRKESEKYNNLISNEMNGSEIIQKEKEKKVIIEVINTDKQTTKRNYENKKLSQKEEKEEKNIYEKSSSKISNISKINKKNYNSKKDINRINKNTKEEVSNNEAKSQNLKIGNNDKKYIESTELFKSDYEEAKINAADNKTSKNEMLAEPNIFEDNFIFPITSPFHNNGK